MGTARLYFVIDAFNDAYRISKGRAQLLLSSDYLIPEGIRHRDDYGVLLTEVVVIMRDRRATRVERINLYSLPARESAVGQRAVMSRGMSAGLRMALRQQLGRRKDASLGLDLDEAAFSELDRRIAADETGEGVYRTMSDRVRDTLQRSACGE